MRWKYEKCKKHPRLFGRGCNMHGYIGEIKSDDIAHSEQ